MSCVHKYATYVLKKEKEKTNRLTTEKEGKKRLHSQDRVHRTFSMNQVKAGKSVVKVIYSMSKSENSKRKKDGEDKHAREKRYKDIL